MRHAGSGFFITAVFLSVSAFASMVMVNINYERQISWQSSRIYCTPWERESFFWGVYYSDLHLLRNEASFNDGALRNGQTNHLQDLQDLRDRLVASLFLSTFRCFMHHFTLLDSRKNHPTRNIM